MKIWQINSYRSRSRSRTFLIEIHSIRYFFRILDWDLDRIRCRYSISYRKIRKFLWFFISEKARLEYDYSQEHAHQNWTIFKIFLCFLGFIFISFLSFFYNFDIFGNYSEKFRYGETSHHTSIRNFVPAWKRKLIEGRWFSSADQRTIVWDAQQQRIYCGKFFIQPWFFCSEW